MRTRTWLATKNAVTIDQLKVAAECVQTMTNAGISENIAIRVFELMVDIYGQVLQGGTPAPPALVSLWSVKAREKGAAIMVEHGTPRRAMALLVFALHQRGNLNKTNLDQLMTQCYRLAVITKAEDQALRDIGARSLGFTTPEARWASAGIVF